MKNLLFKLRIMADFIIAITCFYFGVTLTFSTLFPNLLILFVGVFILFQGLGNIDKVNGYNQDNNSQNKNNKQY